MKKLVLSILVSLFFIGMGAQTMISMSDLFNDNTGNIRKTKDKTLGEIEGSPYLFDEFLPGKIYPKFMDKAFEAVLNVNAFHGMFEFRYEDELYEMPNYVIDSVALFTGTFIPVPIYENDIVSFYSMEIVEQDGRGNFLVKRYIIRFLEATMAKAYQQPKPPRFQSYPAKYYIYNTKENRLIEIKGAKRLSYIDDFREKGIADFVKTYKIKSRNPHDLVRIFNFLYPK